MKYSDNGDFCVLYIEATDEKAELLQVISEQQKPVVLVPGNQAKVPRSPDDFSSLRHLKRQLNVPLVFVIPHSGHLTQLASRFGFPVYLSMDALANALAAGQLTRQRLISGPLRSTGPLNQYRSPRRERDSEPLKAETLVPAGFPSTDEIEEVAFVEPPYEEEPPPMIQKIPPRSDPPSKSAAPSRARRPIEPLDEPLPRRPQPRIPRQPPAEQTQPMPTIRPPSRPPSVRGGSQPFRLFMILFVIALTIAGLGSFLFFYNGFPDTSAPPAAPQRVGHISFISSRQLSERSNQGISDQIVVELSNMPAPAPGKRYYAWLLGDKNNGDNRTVRLGVLDIKDGKTRFFYKGDQNHTNLLAFTSRFLITEEDATVAPVAPSPSFDTWRYYGEFSQVPIKLPEEGKEYSYLDHLRHLLASDPTLDKLELPGGLNVWFYRNVSKIMEWSTSMRDSWEARQDPDFIRRQTARILQYLDGSLFVKRDLPSNAPLLVDERLSHIGLLEVAGPTQDPPCFFTHMMTHLNGLLQSPGAASTLRKDATAMVAALNNINGWLQQVRTDAKTLINMKDGQMKQGNTTLSLINNMIANATNAYSGQQDPASGEMKQGVTWLYNNMQSLATMDIAPYKAQ
uniref:Uncharacterized protein n=1 Tax=Thermosporothrix sp. COM3 TaxID=2490863 RepID=A0A455SEH6_9CHLR|nr:hypothetical protein KTC_06610 [Thermosporothrix sp. COM3]